jgi:hypothetical protein
MAATPQDVERILRPFAVAPEVKGAAWRAYFEATDPDDFEKRFSQIPLPDIGRQALRNLRFGQVPSLAPMPAGGGPVTARPRGELPPPPTAGQIARAGLESLPFLTAAGATLATGPVGWFGTPIVAGLGAIPGEALKQELEERFGLAPPKTPEEAAAGLATAGVEQGAAELGGQLILKPVIKGAGRLFGGPFRQAATLRENIAVKEANEALGLRLTPGQIAGQTPAGAVGRTLEFYGETSMFGRPAIEAARMEGRKNAVKAVEDTLSALAPTTSPELAGRAAQDAFQVGNRIFHERAGTLYAEVDRLARGAAVDMQPIRAEAQRILQREMDMPGFYFPNLGKMGSATRAILEDLGGSQETIPFEIAQRIRTKLLGISPQPGELVAKEAPGMAKHFSGLLTGAMEKSAASLSPEAKTAWLTARTFWREGHDIFERSLVQSLAERNPEALVKAIKPGAVSDVRAIKRAILGYAPFGTSEEAAAAKATWNQFREQFVRTTLLRDPDAVGEQMMDLLDLKRRMNDVGRGVLTEMFGDAEGKTALNNLSTIGEAFSRLRKDMPFIRTYQFVEVARAVNAVITAGATTAAAYKRGPQAALLTATVMEGLPAAIGKIMYYPPATRYFVDGISAFMPEVAKAPTQATTDFLLTQVPKASGLLARAFVTAFEADQARTRAGIPTKQPGLPALPGLENPYRR